MALSAWAHLHGFGWRDRLLMMWVTGIVLCVASFATACRMLEQRGWQWPFMSIFLMRHRLVVGLRTAADMEGFALP
jgi:hypothetical protein